MDSAAIGPDEILAGKPFTDPELTGWEARVMRRMVAREREHVQSWPERSGGRVERDVDDQNRRYLLVVPDTRALLEARALTAVGFFGRPRADVDHDVLYELEAELVTRMADSTGVGLLSYYDIEFVKGAYGNLILFATGDGPKDWAGDPVHRRAVEISAAHYHEVRLHRGSLPGPRLAGELAIASTTYLDFEGATWRGKRRFSAD
jgi:hypothetical protein